jgi:hypothetical protein
MKLTLANAVRTAIIQKLYAYMEAEGEDVGMIASNSFNFPMVYDGEECFVEVVAKVVKKDSDECYMMREDFTMKEAEKVEKKAKAEAEKAKKIAKDQAKREAKKKKEE